MGFEDPSVAVPEIDEGSWVYLSAAQSAEFPIQDLRRHVVDACAASGWATVSCLPEERSGRGADPGHFFESMRHAVEHADVVVALIGVGSEMSEAELALAFSHGRPVVGVQMAGGVPPAAGAQAMLEDYARARVVVCSDAEGCAACVRHLPIPALVRRSGELGERAMTGSPQIFTVGHSNHSPDRFRSLLEANRVDVLVDVRSWPHSRYVEWADAASLPDLVRAAGIKYLFLGERLGGRPEGSDFYDSDGHVLYGKVAATADFQAAIERLQLGAERCRLAIMCSEEDPTHCHRRLLVAKVLIEQGVEVVHIRGDGRCEPEPGPIDLCDGLLFEDEEFLWRSSLSVLRGRRQRTSSAV